MIKLQDKMGRNLTLSQVKEKGINRTYNILLDLELMILRWVGNIPFHFIRLFGYKLAGLKIGKGSKIHMWCNFFNPRGIIIGQDSIIGDHAFLDGRDNIKIGDHVDIASYVMIYNSQHDIHSYDFRAVYGKVIINNYVFIGPRVTVLPSVTVGRGAIVGAGAVVTKNVNPYEIVAGVPAVKIGERKNKNPHYKLGRARLFQ